MDSNNDVVKEKIILQGNGIDSIIYDAKSPVAIPAKRLKGHSDYSWKVISSDGSLETVTPLIKFSTINHPPTAPTNLVPNSPTIIDVKKDFVLSWTNSTDADGDSIKYIMYLRAKEWSFTAEGNSDIPFTSPFIYSFKDFNNGENYTYQIIATDGIDNTFSLEAKLNTIAPGTTSITSPVNNSENVSKDVSFNLSKADNTKKYHLQVASDKDFNNIIKDVHLSKLDTVMILNGNRTYFARAQSELEDLVGIMSNIITFKTINTAPIAAKNLLPNNSSIDANTANYFKWDKATDSDNDLLAEKVIIRSDDGFELSYTDAISPILISKDILKGHANYTWKIVSSDGSLETVTTPVPFQTINHAPTAWQFIRPKQNEVITFTKGQYKIETTNSTDVDKDLLKKTVRIQGLGLDSLINLNSSNIAYIDSVKLHSNSEYELSGDVTDGLSITYSQPIKFKTPIYVGVESLLNNSNFKEYPNPTSGKVSITLNDDRLIGTYLTVYNVLGSVIQKHLIRQSEEIIDLSGNTPGVYLIRSDLKEFTPVRIVLK